MSKINTFRIINLNYNNEANKIEDEIFEFDGNSTLLSLQNGGGKTVLVQMMLAPYVHKKYRSTPDRLFDSFFTSNKPTFILTEWQLDGGNGYVLVGMMVRKSQSDNEEKNESIDICNFIYEYKDNNQEGGYDIRNFPVVTFEGKQKKLKSFNDSKRLFEELKLNKNQKFQYFDINQSLQQRQYFKKLLEFGIDSDEWETIIRKINNKESGLSDLFKDAKDEVGLVEKWFLPSVETKLNKEANRIKQFQHIIVKFIQQYKENSVKIKRKEIILKFKEDIEEVIKCGKTNQELIEMFESKGQMISGLKAEIIMILEKAKNLENKMSEKLDELYRDLNKIKLEDLSFEIYNYLSELENINQQRQLLVNEINNQRIEKSQIEKNYHTYCCARNYEDYKHEEKNLLSLENKYQALKIDEKDKLPLISNLGYNLNILYKDKLDIIKENSESTTGEIKNLKSIKIEITKENQLSKNEKDKCLRDLGAAKSNVNMFFDREKELLNKFDIRINKNILGFYEEGTLEILEMKYQKMFEENEKNKMLSYQSLTETEEKREANQRQIQDSYKLLAQLNEKRIQFLESLQEADKEMEERLKYMKYLAIPENSQFDKAIICKEFSEKIKLLKEIEKKADKQLESLKNEIDKLNHGIFLEIPEELENLLKDLEINYVYGFDYLKKNEELIYKKDLLPYSIIISEEEFKRLKKAEIKFHTSILVPIVIKEKLKDKEHSKEELKFEYFTSFDQILLDENQLKMLVVNKEKNLEELKKQSTQKNEEIIFYEEILNKIQFQKTTKESYKQIKEKLEEAEQKISLEDEKLTKARIEKTKLDTQIQSLHECIKEEEAKRIELLNIKESIKELCKKYNEYISSKKEVENLSLLIKKIEDEITERNYLIEKNDQLIIEKSIYITNLEKEIEATKLKHQKFSTYTEGELLNKEIVDIETNFEALSSKLNSDINEIELQLEESRVQFDRIQTRLIEYAKKHDVLDEEYRKIKYNKFIEDELESQIDLISKEINNNEEKINSFITKAAVIESNIKNKKDEIYKNFGTEEIVPKENITNTQFVQRKKIIQNSIDETLKAQKSLIRRINNYEGNISALLEFKALEDEGSLRQIDFQKEISEFGKIKLEDLDKNEIESLYQRLIRDYRTIKDEIEKSARKLEKTIESILEKESYQEDFYKLPLQRILETSRTPLVMLSQIETTVKSYETLLEKILIDISFVEQEKEKIREMLLDYIFEINKNLDKIDRNSRITVKDRNIKMLRIQVPSWEDNKDNFTFRLKEFIDNLIESGLKCIMDNLNLEEMIGLRLTSKALYDEVIGISKIIIKLYKIESQREYQITWAQVSKNSGGEGFLSAFIVLSSLLSYMRRDESDLFIEKEEGKVVIMDNPFAQTSSSHLLIPLMEMAKKCNTQLICLTGLGGESIYNRFDNIYVLNLIESGLNKDILYLKGEHVKGETKVYKMSTSRIKVEDEVQLSFETLF